MSTRSPDLIPLAELPTYWQGRANALRLLDQQRTSSNVATLDTADTYETCANELREARKAAAPEVQAAQVNLTPPMGINVGWQTIRNVLEAVHPGWEPTHNSDPDPTWDFAKALIEGYIASTYRECLHCNKSFDPYFLYRCWDCDASVCKNCVGLHMGPSHKPHAQSSPVVPDQHVGANVSDGDELLPCPFCGSGAKPETGRYGFKSIVCTTCCAETAPATSDEQASTWWNRRSIQSQATDAPAEGTSVGEITWHSIRARKGQTT